MQMKINVQARMVLTMVAICFMGSSYCASGILLNILFPQYVKAVSDFRQLESV